MQASTEGTRDHAYRPDIDVRASPAQPRRRALVVEDDEGIARFVELGLGYEGFDVTCVRDGLSAIRSAAQIQPDLVILDVRLPGLDGFEVCRRLRIGGDPAILMLTARGEVQDRVTGLEAGADDYIVKPFHFDELLARIHAVDRRRAKHLDAHLRYADVELDPLAHTVRQGGHLVELTPREFALLEVLMEEPRRVFPKQTLIERVWGYDFVGDDNIVEVYVGYLRNKLQDQAPGRLIRTVRGVGYVLRAADDS